MGEIPRDLAPPGGEIPRDLAPGGGGGEITGGGGAKSLGHRSTNIIARRLVLKKTVFLRGRVR